MSKNKLGPYILIVFLLLILVFVAGVRYGQKVEQTNKFINYLSLLSPTRPQTTPASLQFATYKNEACGLQFLYPTSLKKEKESSFSAQFTNENGSALSFNCDPNQTSLLTEEENVATEEIKLQNKKIMATNKNGLLTFRIKNPQNYKTISFTVPKSLYPLFETSLQFSSVIK